MRRAASSGSKYEFFNFGVEMTSDLDLEQKGEEFNEARNRAICHDAAIFVTLGFDREVAIKKAEDIFQCQQEAEVDPTGALETLDEAQSPQMPKGCKSQVTAIANELFEEYFA